MKLLKAVLVRILIFVVIVLMVFSCDSNVFASDFVTVAVIDSGLDQNIMDGGYENGICKYGHKDFTGTGFSDPSGHGTNVSGLIHKYAKSKKYCQVILKYWHPNLNGKSAIDYMIQAVRYAIDIGVDYINISGGGSGYSKLEHTAVAVALNKNIKIITAAGNHGYRLGSTISYKNKTGRIIRKIASYYPAMYSRHIIVVGNGMNTSNRHISSNYGSPIDVWENGIDAVGAYGRSMTGTSQSTAIHTGKLVNKHVQSR